MYDHGGQVDAPYSTLSVRNSVVFERKTVKSSFFVIPHKFCFLQNVGIRKLYVAVFVLSNKVQAKHNIY